MCIRDSPYYLACVLIPATHLLIYQIDIQKWGNLLVAGVAVVIFVACLVLAYQNRNIRNNIALGIGGAFMAFSCLFVSVLDFVV